MSLRYWGYTRIHSLYLCLILYICCCFLPKMVFRCIFCHVQQLFWTSLWFSLDGVWCSSHVHFKRRVQSATSVHDCLAAHYILTAICRGLKHELLGRLLWPPSWYPGFMVGFASFGLGIWTGVISFGCFLAEQKRGTFTKRLNISNPIQSRSTCWIFLVKNQCQQHHDVSWQFYMFYQSAFVYQASLHASTCH